MKMSKNYDEFVKLKQKEMSRKISDMTFTYLQPETKQPTYVPASHYEKILGQSIEEAISETAQLTLLNTFYTQINALKKENPVLWDKTMICLEMGIKPADMQIQEKNALIETFDFIQESRKTQKTKFHFMDERYVNFYNNSMEDMQRQAELMYGEYVKEHALLNGAEAQQEILLKIEDTVYDVAMTMDEIVEGTQIYEEETKYQMEFLNHKSSPVFTIEIDKDKMEQLNFETFKTDIENMIMDNTREYDGVGYTIKPKGIRQEQDVKHTLN